MAAYVALLLSCKHATSTTENKTVLSNPPESWCPEGFESGPSDTCFAIPDHPTSNTPVLVYLHGTYEGRGAPAESEAVRLAIQRGFAVVIPRGKRGLCAWRAELKDRYCWPQDPEDTESIKSIVAEWDRVLWQVDALLEGGTHKRYVLGSSIGGSFASFLATHGLFAGQAYAVVNGGAFGPLGTTKPVPMLLVSAATDDPEQKTKELHERLAKASWTHAFCPRGGTQALTSEDVELALRFFKRDVEGGLKPQGRAYPCDGATSKR
jgi:poly(3-hydroxybutyrate) depolymerase